MLRLEDLNLRGKKALKVLRWLIEIDPSLLSEKDKQKIGLGVLE